MSISNVRKVTRLHHNHYGVPGMLGSLDCMHVEWDHCLKVWKGQFKEGKYKKASIMMEAMADHSRWLWLPSFGYAGSLNDINIWDQSPIHKMLVDGSFADKDFMFEIGGVEFNLLWILGPFFIYFACAFLKNVIIIILTILFIHTIKWMAYTQNWQGL